MAKKNEVAVVEDQELATLQDQYSGEGYSSAPEDNLVPLVMILQKQSPQVEEQDPRYIPGAKPSDIWLRNAAEPIVKGSDGILFQQCFFVVNWMEWVPRERGGGYAARHVELPADATKMVDPTNPNRVKYIRPNGNEVMQTRNHVGYVIKNGLALPYVIPMTSSGHTVSRTWMNIIGQQQTRNGKIAAAYAFFYRMKTRLRTNPFGSWFTWEIKLETLPPDADGTIRPVQATRAELERGHELHLAFVSGQRDAEAPPAHDDAM